MKGRSKAGGEAGKSARDKAVTRKHHRAVPGRRSATTTQETEIARLARERDQALEREKATAEVLRVVSSSPGELRTVFRTILENATRLCEAKFGVLYRFVDGAFRFAAEVGTPLEYVEFLRARGPFVPPPGTFVDHVLQTKQTYHTDDYAADAVAGPGARLGGARSTLGVPMLKDGKLIGAILVYRQEVRPFGDKQIALLTNFADQAVIAIENARLLNELRERTTDLAESLEQQTATSEVLQVISSSPGDLRPVFATMLEKAVRLSGAKFGNLFLREGDAFRTVAMHNASPAYAEARMHALIRPGPDAALGRLARTKQPAQIEDVMATPGYIAGDPFFVSAVELSGARTMLAVPMLKDDQLVGSINIYRQEVIPFNQKQIDIVSNFAAQAVIAIENARLLSELRQRTDDLSKTLENLRTAQDRLVQTQKLASLGQLTAGIAHEIKNPLNFVNNFSGISVELIDELQEALQRVQADDRTRNEIGELADTLRDNLGKIVQHGQRADAIVKNMLLHSREGSGEHRPIDINALVEDALNLAYHGARAEKQDFTITLQRSFDPQAGQADVFPQDITRVLLNLISNAFYAATQRGGTIGSEGFQPTIAAATRSLGDRVEIGIRDNGTGIPPDVKEKMFNPFFTTKPAGEGTGLGLSISYDIVVKQHAGSIEVDTQPGKFTEIRIILPRSAAHFQGNRPDVYF